jgi:hypothetical protein
MPARQGSTLGNLLRFGSTPVNLVRQGTTLVWQGNTSTHTLVVLSTPGTAFASFSGTGDGATPLTGFIGGNNVQAGNGVTGSQVNRDALLKVNRAGTLRWDCTASSEANYDFGRLLINGVQMFSISGTQNTVGTAAVTTSSSVILRYRKDWTITQGQDRMAVNSLYVADLPGVPTGLVGTAAASSVTLAWTAPASDGNAPITDYAVEFGPDTASYAAITRTPSTAATQAVTGLTPQTEYVFRVAAVNGIGTGSFTSPITRTTLAPTVPGAPTGLTANPDGYGGVSISWAAPADNGGAAITDYTIQYSSNGGTSWTNFAWTQWYGLSEYLSLTSGTEYTFRVAAVNSAGTGAWSATATATA